MADSQRESQRQRHKPVEVGESKAQVQKERMFLLTFFLGGVSLVAAMFWIADGLSDNFKVSSTPFIVFVVTAGLSGTSALLSKLLIKE